jgi:transcriptional regulator with XRE-family HTH domain
MTRRFSDYDKIISENLLTIRMASGKSQQNLADWLGICFQQVQKYERAINRIPAGRLFEMADFFGVSVTKFYDGILHMKRRSASKKNQVHLNV